MKRTWCVVLGFGLLAAPVFAEEMPVLNTMKDKVSYATGVQMVRSFQRQGVEVDKDLFLKGVQDGISGGTLLMSDDEFHKTLKMFQTEQKVKLAERKRQQAELLRRQREKATKVEPSSTTPIATDNTQR
jgi:FKBP-type peptidyl-prolyl cis-trans isomerase FklB